MNCHTVRAAPSARGGMAERRGWPGCEVISDPCVPTLWVGTTRGILRPPPMSFPTITERARAYWYSAGHESSYKYIQVWGKFIRMWREIRDDSQMLSRSPCLCERGHAGGRCARNARWEVVHRLVFNGRGALHGRAAQRQGSSPLPEWLVLECDLPKCWEDATEHGSICKHAPIICLCICPVFARANTDTTAGAVFAVFAVFAIRWKHWSKYSH